MATFRIERGTGPMPPETLGGGVCVGNFDGVHLGHAALLGQARRVVGPDSPVVVVTFDPHPLSLLAPERYKPALTTSTGRAEWLARAGADRVVILRTTPELLRLGPEEFYREIVRDGLRARAVIEGFNFRFGRDRAGDNDLLRRLCMADGLGFAECPPHMLDGVVVSSSRVRDALTSGDVRGAARLLARNYALDGRVVEGRKRGRTLGFPTANLGHVETLVPGEGVYAVWARLDGVRHGAVANVGPNPTFGEQERKIEVHLMNFDGDIYGRGLTVEFVEKVRDVRKFPDVDTLSRQIVADAGRAGQILADEPALEGA